MSIKLSWFKEILKSENQKEKERLEVEKARLEVELLKKDKEAYEKFENLPEEEEEPEKPYRNLKLINDLLTIVLNDGNIISKPGATQEDFKKAREASTEVELFRIAASSEGIEEMRQEEVEAAKNKALFKGIELLKEHSDFIVTEDSVYLKGINRSLPQLLVEKFAEIIGKGEEETEEYLALKRFFMWCCLNPRAEVADKLYDFLIRNSFKITKQGFFTALRNVVTVEGDNELVKFVSNAYNKVKAIWKKKPIDYFVLQNKDGYFFSRGDKPVEEASKIIGNLQDLYLDLPNMAGNRFTDDYTRKFDIRIGQVVTMPPEECSWSTADCAQAGLHFTADQIHYVGCGDTSVLVLINPMKVVGIGESKGRCYEYLPIMTVPREEATTLLHDLDFDTLELDEIFAISELDDLTERAKEGFAIEAKKHSFNLPQISSEEIVNIVASLEKMKEAISERVVEFD